MIGLHMHDIMPKDVLVKLLTCKHNGQELLLDLSIPDLSLGKASGCKTHWLLKLKQSGSQPCVRNVALEGSLILRAVKAQNRGFVRWQS